MRSATAAKPSPHPCALPRYAPIRPARMLWGSLLRQIDCARRAKAAEWVQFLRRPRLQVGIDLIVQQRHVVGDVVAGLCGHGRPRSSAFIVGAPIRTSVARTGLLVAVVKIRYRG